MTVSGSFGQSAVSRCRVSASAWSTVRPHRVLIAAQSARYVHRYPAAGGSQSVTSLSALERLERAETAISARGSSRSLA